jgi:hypothetical protein
VWQKQGQVGLKELRARESRESKIEIKMSSDVGSIRALEDII